MRSVKNISLILCIFLLVSFCVAGCYPAPAIDPTTPIATTNSPSEPSQATTTPSTEENVPTVPSSGISSETTVPADTEPVTEPLNTTEAGSDAPTMEAEHEHVFVENYTVAPACTKEGYTLFSCSCGAYYTDRHTPATGHFWSEWTVTREPTVDEEGESARSCFNCAETEVQVLAKLDPPVQTEPADTVPPTDDTHPDTTDPTEPSEENTIPDETETATGSTEPTVQDPVPGETESEAGESSTNSTDSTDPTVSTTNPGEDIPSSTEPDDIPEGESGTSETPEETEADNTSTTSEPTVADPSDPAETTSSDNS